MEMIRCENVCFDYNTNNQITKALKGVSATFETKKMYAVKGRSGSGKSTFLSLLAGLELPTSGSIYIENEDMSVMDRDMYRRYRASVIYQAFHLFPLLTVLENVTFPMEIQKKERKKSIKKARQILFDVGITEDKHNKKPDMLSGGEQQRVGIARAIAAGGSILLADEPTGNLDSENEKIIIGLLQEFAHKDGHVVIVVTHNDSVINSADLVYEMREGLLYDKQLY